MAYERAKQHQHQRQLSRGKSEVLGWTAGFHHLHLLHVYLATATKALRTLFSCCCSVHSFPYLLAGDFKSCPNNCTLGYSERVSAGFKASPGATVPDLSWSRAVRCSVAERKLTCLISPCCGDSLWQTHVVMARNEHTPTNNWKRDYALFFGPIIALLWKWLRWLYYTFPPWTMPLLDHVKYMRNEVLWEGSKQHSQVASPNQGVLGIKALGTDSLCPDSCVCVCQY